jgi:hypothetical protein
MDDDALRPTRGEINRLPCAFERALCARHAVCELAVHSQAGGRESVACVQPLARALCAQLVSLLREKSAFTMRLRPAVRSVSPATLMKIQCGGLDGLKAVIEPAALAPNVRRLVRLAQERYGALAALPFSEIVQGVAAWKPGGR